MSRSENPTVTIAPGVEMPLLGFGTWMATGDDVRRALEVGYRHIDTATMYRNEGQIGQALRGSGLARDEVFLTTKLPQGSAGSERETIEASLAALGVDQVDLWLIHWPPGGRARPDVWQRFIEIAEAGLTRAIGVSNYDLEQIDEITEATGVAPAVDQIPWSPSLFDAAVADGLRARGVTLEGYSPFKTANANDPVLTAIAERHGVTTHQVILRWHVDHGFVVIPKSSDPERIAANFDIFGFELTAAELAAIDELGG
jgi:diketogulonate reductase-like aldo/keto reductase